MQSAKSGRERAGAGDEKKEEHKKKMHRKAAGDVLHRPLSRRNY